MAENVLKLKKEAVRLGMNKSDARTANRTTLENFIAKAGKAVAKKKGTATTAKKKATVKASKSTAKAGTKRSKSAPAAKSAKSGKAKRPTTTRKSNKSTDNGGRNMIGSLDFSITDGWNPREGSPVAEIFKALKKAKGNVDKTFDVLVPRVKDFVSARKNDGSRRTKAEMEAMLRYRINRTKFQFALQTGQHESSTERVAYGTGPYASTRKAKAKRSAKAKASTRKPNTRKATTGKKRGRPAKRR